MSIQSIKAGPHWQVNKVVYPIEKLIFVLSSSKNKSNYDVTKGFNINSSVELPNNMSQILIW